MKEGWEYKKLRELSSFIADGDWIESKDQSTNGIRLIQTGNIGNGIYKSKEDKPHFITEKTFEELNCTEIFEGDCLVSRLPDPVGRACLIPYITFRAITAVDCTILRFKDIIHPQYFVYYTQSTNYLSKIYQKTTGSTRKRISRKNLETIVIPVPPLSIQQSIVSELDKIHEIIDLKKAQLKDLDLLAQSIFYDIFGDPIENPKGWEVKKLGELCTIVRGGSPRPIQKYLGGSIPWIKIGDATDGDNIYLHQTKEHIIEEGLKKTRYVKAGSLIFANCGVSLGFARIITFDGCIHDGWLALENVKDYIDKVFLLKSLNECTNYFRRTAPDGTQPNLNTGIMKSFKQIIPPKEMQFSYLDKIQAIESQKSAIKKSLAEVETLLASRMDYYFN